jgi:hypothetical protein
MFGGTPASAATTNAAALQKANQGGAVDASALAQAQAERAKFGVLTPMYDLASNYIKTLGPTGGMDVGRDVMNRLGPGTDTQSAEMGHQIANMTPQQKMQLAMIAGGQSLSASADASLGLQNRSLNLQEHQQLMSSAMAGLDYDLKLQAFKAKRGIDPELSKTVADVLNQRRMAIEALNNGQRGGTLTPEGARMYMQSINNLNEFLRRTAPDIYGPGQPNPTLRVEDFPTNMQSSAAGALPTLYNIIQSGTKK